MHFSSVRMLHRRRRPTCSPTSGVPAVMDTPVCAIGAVLRAQGRLTAIYPCHMAPIFIFILRQPCSRIVSLRVPATTYPIPTTRLSYIHPPLPQCACPTQWLPRRVSPAPWLATPKPPRVSPAYGYGSPPRGSLCPMALLLLRLRTARLSATRLSLPQCCTKATPTSRHRHTVLYILTARMLW